jgi:hypothetical protein
MDAVRLEHKFIIKFFTKNGNGSNIVHHLMLAVYGGAASSKYQMKY